MKCETHACYFSAQGLLWKLDLGSGQARPFDKADTVLGMRSGRLIVRSGEALKSVSVEVKP